jgi:hypothetical protein
MPILEKRLGCLANDLASESTALSPSLSDFKLTALDIHQYILLIKNSIVSDKVKVKYFLESIALGNLRDSLDFFRTFLLSENTDTSKIISFMRDGEKYLVPDHEFIKSIALGSKQFFSEIESPILNLFSIMDMQTPSYFTKFRILNLLNAIHHQASPYGPGYEKINKLISLFNEIDVSKEDVQKSINSLTLKGLIENDFHSKKYLDNANAVRITPTGNYYITYLSRKFIYIDLIQQETPIFDKNIFDQMDQIAESTNMDDRIQRCRLFVNYLIVQEGLELEKNKKIAKTDFLINSYMPYINREFEYDIGRIQGKLERKGILGKIQEKLVRKEIN